MESTTLCEDSCDFSLDAEASFEDMEVAALSRSAVLETTAQEKLMESLSPVSPGWLASLRSGVERQLHAAAGDDSSHGTLRTEPFSQSPRTDPWHSPKSKLAAVTSPSSLSPRKRAKQELMANQKLTLPIDSRALPAPTSCMATLFTSTAEGADGVSPKRGRAGPQGLATAAGTGAARALGGDPLAASPRSPAVLLPDLAASPRPLTSPGAHVVEAGMVLNWLSPSAGTQGSLLGFPGSFAPCLGGQALDVSGLLPENSPSIVLSLQVRAQGQNKGAFPLPGVKAITEMRKLPGVSHAVSSPASPISPAIKRRR